MTFWDWSWRGEKRKSDECSRRVGEGGGREDGG